MIRTETTGRDRPEVIPEALDDPQEIANAAAKACFEWRTNAVDNDGNDCLPPHDEEGAGWHKTSEEVDISLSSIEGTGAEVGLNPEMYGYVEDYLQNGGPSCIKVTLSQIGFRRAGDIPTATYSVKSWEHV